MEWSPNISSDAHAGPQDEEIQVVGKFDVSARIEHVDCSRVARESMPSVEISSYKPTFHFYSEGSHFDYFCVADHPAFWPVKDHKRVCRYQSGT